MDRRGQAVGGEEWRNGLEDGFPKTGTELPLILYLFLYLVQIGVYVPCINHIQS